MRLENLARPQGGIKIAIKVGVAIAAIFSIIIFAAQNIFGRAHALNAIGVLIISFIFLAAIFLIYCTIAVVWRRYCLRHGALDPAWLWFPADPPGVEAQRRGDGPNNSRETRQSGEST